MVENKIDSTQGGTIKFFDLNAAEVPGVAGGPSRLVALKRNGEVAILDPKGRELERYKVPYGASVLVKAGQEMKVAECLGGG